MIGFTFNNVHTSFFDGLIVKTLSKQIIAAKNKQEISVVDKDGLYIFEGAYENKKISYKCSLVDVDISSRTSKLRDITKWLSSIGELVLDYDPDIIYEVVKITNDVTVAINQIYDTFNIEFTVKPIQKSEVTSQKEWMNPSGTIAIINAGNYKSLPVLEITGTGDITIECGSKSFDYVGLDGTIFVDSYNYLVYSVEVSKVNKLSNYSGDFIELLPGSNDLFITGTITNLKVNYFNCFI